MPIMSGFDEVGCVGWGILGFLFAASGVYYVCEAILVVILTDSDGEVNKANKRFFLEYCWKTGRPPTVSFDKSNKRSHS